MTYFRFPDIHLGVTCPALSQEFQSAPSGFSHQTRVLHQAMRLWPAQQKRRGLKDKTLGSSLCLQANHVSFLLACLDLKVNQMIKFNKYLLGPSFAKEKIKDSWELLLLVPGLVGSESCKFSLKCCNRAREILQGLRCTQLTLFPSPTLPMIPLVVGDP